jgi:hypothetical protein
MSVIKHDFGLTKHQTARRFRKLLSLDALHDANVQANPMPYLERASERIFQLEKTLFEAAQAAKPPSGGPASGEPPSPETIEVDKAQYQCLLNCRAIVEKGLAQLGSGQEDS